jgi:hypothetical protein
MRPWLPAVILASCASFAAAPEAAALSLFQIDTFEGDTQGWGAGQSGAAAPAQVPDGGPLGDGDGFLRIQSVGGSAAFSRLSAFNDSTWTGNFTAAGVTAIRADLRNLGATDLLLRIQLEGAGGKFQSVQGFPLPAGSGWTEAVFPLGGADLTGENIGGVVLSATLAQVFKLRILHAATPAFPPETVVGDLGVDNLTAVPEPSAALLAGLGAALALALRRRLPRDPR